MVTGITDDFRGGERASLIILAAGLAPAPVGSLLFIPETEDVVAGHRIRLVGAAAAEVDMVVFLLALMTGRVLLEATFMVRST